MSPLTQPNRSCVEVSSQYVTGARRQGRIPGPKRMIGHRPSPKPHAGPPVVPNRRSAPSRDRVAAGSRLRGLWVLVFGQGLGRRQSVPGALPLSRFHPAKAKPRTGEGRRRRVAPPPLAPAARLHRTEATAAHPSLQARHGSWANSLALPPSPRAGPLAAGAYPRLPPVSPMAGFRRARVPCRVATTGSSRRSVATKTRNHDEVWRSRTRAPGRFPKHCPVGDRSHR